MVHLVAPYTIDGVDNSSIEEAIKYLSQLKIIGLDLETAPLDMEYGTAYKK